MANIFAEFTTERERPDGTGTYRYFDRVAAEEKYGKVAVDHAIWESKRSMRYQTN